MPLTSLAWRSEDTVPVLVLAAVTLLFVLFHYFGREGHTLRFVSTELPDNERQAHAVLLERAVGFIALGVVPAGLTLLLPGGLEAHGVGLGRAAPSLALLAVVMLVAVPITRKTSMGQGPEGPLPRVRMRRWDTRFKVLNVGSHALYLLGYEYLFRGFLLFTMAEWVGAWPAIAITTLAYVYAHLHKHAGETLGSVAFGVALAAATLASGSILAAWVAHTLVAVTGDVFALPQRALSSIEGDR